MTMEDEPKEFLHQIIASESCFGKFLPRMWQPKTRQWTACPSRHAPIQSTCSVSPLPCLLSFYFGKHTPYGFSLLLWSITFRNSHSHPCLHGRRSYYDAHFYDCIYPAQISYKLKMVALESFNQWLKTVGEGKFSMGWCLLGESASSYQKISTLSYSCFVCFEGHLFAFTARFWHPLF